MLECLKIVPKCQVSSVRIKCQEGGVANRSARALQRPVDYKGRLAHFQVSKYHPLKMKKKKVTYIGLRIEIKLVL